MKNQKNKKLQKIQRQKIVKFPDDLPDDFGLQHQSDPVFMWLKGISNRLYRLEQSIGIDKIALK